MVLCSNDSEPASDTPSSLLEELLGPNVNPFFLSTEQFEQDIEDFLLDSTSNGDASSFDPSAFSAIDWSIAFNRPALSASPSSVLSGHAGSVPPSPLSDVTLVDDGTRFSSKRWNPDEPLDSDIVAASSPSPGPTPFEGDYEITFTFESRLHLESLPPPAPSPQTADRRLEARPPKSRHAKRAASTIDDVPTMCVEKKPAKRRRRQDTTRRFECGECSSLFARNHNLKVHMATVHQGVRRFACESCNEAFGRKHDLARHTQSKHTKLGSPRRKPGACAKH
ncbi:hypothetical protein C8Q77DRAFT_1159853 [Trametes polyzona]|nr:hypothetical protein C8Q77DRAFT_1159853 [Trametes polyzona]